MFRFWFIGLWLLCWFIPASGEPSRVSEFTLANGLKILVKEDHRAPVVVFQIWYQVGSADEPRGSTGISHVLEHMMFKATESHPVGEFAKLISASGGSYNAMTTADYTTYYETLSVQSLPLAVELEADRMQNLKFNSTEFSREIQVILEERRMRLDDNPQSQTLDQFNRMAYRHMPYEIPVIGETADLKSMTSEKLEKWYRKWYQPKNALLVVVGDVSPHAVLQLAKKNFGNLSNTSESLAAKVVLPGIPPVMAQHKLVKHAKINEFEVKVPAKVPWLLMGFRVPSLSTPEEAWEPYALMVANNLLSGGDSARLSRELIRGRTIVTEAGADYAPVARYDALFVLAGTPTPAHNLSELQHQFYAQIERLRTQLASADELERAKIQIISAKTYQRDSLYNQSLELGSLFSTGQAWQASENLVSQVRSVSAAQVRKVANKYFVKDRLTIARLVPQKYQ